MNEIKQQKEKEMLEPKKVWFETIGRDPRFEKGKFYAVVAGKFPEQEVYGPFDDRKQVDEFFENLGFKETPEEEWELQPLDLIEAKKLGRKYTGKKLNGWFLKGEWIQDALKRKVAPGVPPPSEPLKKPVSAETESKFSDLFHVSKF
ncbi:MAG: hypothetical protein HYT63_01550 [Candidatus Yanofskybacteria bacterium]|nr:hypothetical protein [Candidatus Yanofskybacteria bacterium]